VIVPSFHESAAITPCGNNVGHSVISPGSCAAVLQTIASRRQPIQRVVLSAKQRFVACPTGAACAPH
jgi:hypothetical protein